MPAHRGIAVAICVTSLLGAADTAPAQAEFFENKVRPLLAGNCYACHADSQMGGLRVDSRDAVIQGGKSGPAVIPGKPEESLMVQAIRRTHARLKMPPTAPLAPADVAVVEKWIAGGAFWPEAQVKPGPAPVISAAHRAFWSFQPIRKSEPPAIRHKSQVRNPVDGFILAALEAKGLEPAPPAAPGVLLRRVTLDLTGLPPTPEEYDAFLNDKSPDAFARVVDRLLESPHYGERWGRHWLDLARYSDGRLAAGTDTPLPNAWRYRDWVVDAFNKDLPYDQFVMAQIAADFLPPDRRGALMSGLGFQSLGTSTHDQVDVTARVFLGLTVGCAQCHDHKYDPIPTRDYYSLYGVFRSSKDHEFPLAPSETVQQWEANKKKIDALKEEIADFLKAQSQQLVDILARRTADYLVASWKVGKGAYADAAAAAAAEKLDQTTLERWIAYLGRRADREHSYLDAWYKATEGSPTEKEVRQAAEAYHAFVIELLADQREVEDKNYVAFGGRKGMKDERTRQYTNIVSLPVLKFYQWRELASEPYRREGEDRTPGVYYYGPKEIDRFIGGAWRVHLDAMRADLAAMEKALPERYPFLHTITDGKVADSKVHIRGDGGNLGEVAPRRFLEVLCDKEAKPFSNGSGRLELANSIVASPLAARVIANRVWQFHFGQGLVRTPSNFGQMGERPSHPELLDYLAASLQESGWSLKKLHRLILLSSTYARSTTHIETNFQADPNNQLLWRASPRPRLDLESLRDSILAVSGKLDRTAGGPPAPYSDTNLRRSIYLTVSRTRVDGTMSLFDFPDPNATTDERSVTMGSLQGLFFLNSGFVSSQASALAARVSKEAGESPGARVDRAYKVLYGRAPQPSERQIGIEYLSADPEKRLPEYLQALLGSAEFTSVN